MHDPGGLRVLSELIGYSGGKPLPHEWHLKQTKITKN